MLKLREICNFIQGYITVPFTNADIPNTLQGNTSDSVRKEANKCD